MKKLLFMAALAGLTLSSCTNDNVEALQSDTLMDEISFAPPVMYHVSRVVGEIKGTQYPFTENFIVYGVKYDASKAYPGWGAEGVQNEFPDEGSEVAARFDEGNWEPTGWFPKFAHYYKNEFSYAFGAYSPSSYHTGITYSKTAGLQVKGFTPAALGSQIDLMYAPRVYDKNLKTEMQHGEKGNEFYDGINLAFKHALSSVHFRVCVDPRYKRAMKSSGYKFVDGDFKIKSITMTRVKNVGDFNEHITNEEAASDRNIYKAVPVWTLTGATTDYKFLDSPEYIDVKLPTDEEVTISQAAKDITTMKGHYGLLLPQDIENSGIKVIIEWQHRKWIDDDNFILDDMKTEVVLEDSMKKNKIWKQGIRHIYNIVFRENLIYFAPSIEDWLEVEDDIYPNPDDNVIVP